MSPALQRPAIRRAAALGILAMLLNGIYVLALGPYLDALEHNRQSIAQLETALDRYRRAGSQLPDLQNRLESSRHSGTVLSGYLESNNEAVAAAQLQDRLKATLAREGGNLSSTQVLGGKDEGKARRIAIRGQMTIRIAALQRVLYDLESGSPYLFIDNLDIRTVSAAADSGGEDDLLDVGFDVYGYLWRAP